MLLTERVLQAHGGRTRWSETSVFSAHVSIGGELLLSEGRSLHNVADNRFGDRQAPHPLTDRASSEIVIEGDTHQPFARLYGAADSARFAVYMPERVELRSMAGKLIEALDRPGDGFVERGSPRPFAILESAFLFGALAWNAIVGPFVLTLGGRAENPSGDILQMELPPSLDPVTAGRRLAIDAQGLARQVEFELQLFPGLRVIDSLSAYSTFDGITLPTLHRMKAILPDGKIAPSPLVDIEIFDVRFL
jgi:hypothetical protein